MCVAISSRTVSGSLFIAAVKRLPSLVGKERERFRIRVDALALAKPTEAALHLIRDQFVGNPSCLTFNFSFCAR